MSEKLTDSTQWKTRAPANTMILGEHSVVYGHPALACAVNQFITIEWQQRTDSALNIESALGSHHTQIDQITLHPKLAFVIAALHAFQKHLPCGLDITIHSEFSSTIGLGSSAAVLAGMLDGLNHICQTQKTDIELFTIGHKIILDIQKRGSGTDLAASLSGGVIYFQPQNEVVNQPEIHKLSLSLPLALIYSGYKTPTADVLALVAKNWQNKPKQRELLYRSMAKITRTAYKHLQAKEMEEFYQQIGLYQQQMQKLGVSDETLEKIIQALNGCLSIYSAKISGSGLGDCVIGIGELHNCSSSSQVVLQNYQSLDIKITPQGASTLKIDANI